MSDTFAVELTSAQKELLLCGLRYLRSRALLEMKEPTEEAMEARRRQLDDVAELVELLNDAHPVTAAKV